MQNEKKIRFIEKFWLLRRTGYTLIAIALAFLMVLLYSPEIRAPYLSVYSYAVFGIGILLVLANKALEIIQYSRLKKATVQCLNCGWFGPGRDWYRSECCPECDSTRVVPVSRVN